jgi:hypothetical protein
MRVAAGGFGVICIALATTVEVRAQAASDAADVVRLLRAGDAVHALDRIDAVLAKNPDSADMRFRRGIALSMLMRDDEAIAVFERLVEEHPEMPGSYNNLAVLYSAHGELEKARTTLEKATQAYPGYGVAYANLGDVYAQLARQAYSKAIELNTPDPSLAGKLERLPGPGKGSEAGAPSPRASAGMAAAVLAGGSMTRTAAGPAPAAPSANASANASGVASGVAAAIAAWADAWSRKDMDTYVAAYTRAFTGSAPSHAAWVKEREARIVPRRRIHVEVSALRVEMHGDRAVAHFDQTYQSDTTNETSRKTLELVRQEGDRWQIEQETAGE